MLLRVSVELLPVVVLLLTELLQNMIPGLLVNGTMGKVVSFHTIYEAKGLGYNIIRDRTSDISSIKQFMEKMGCIEEISIDPTSGNRIVSWGNLRRTNVLPLVEFDNEPRMLCVPLAFKNHGV
jgi:hypothetical protein